MSRKRKIPAELVNAAYPVDRIEVFKNGSIRVIRKDLTQGQTKSTQPDRSSIKVLSSKSRMRLALVAIETRTEFETLITLSYPQVWPQSGKEVKLDIKKFLRQMEKEFEMFRYLWFLEFQKRGAPHVHIFTDLPEPTYQQREQMAWVWAFDCLHLSSYAYTQLSPRRETSLVESCVLVHRHPAAWQKIRDDNGARRYVLKYATKTHQKAVPEAFRNVGRFWGTDHLTGKVEPQVSVPMSELLLREILREHRPDIAAWEVLPEVILNCFT